MDDNTHIALVAQALHAAGTIASVVQVVAAAAVYGHADVDVDAALDGLEAVYADLQAKLERLAAEAPPALQPFLPRLAPPPPL